MEAIFAALITGAVALVAAFAAGGFTLFNTWRLNKKDAEIESLKGEISRDIERLKAELSHGQVVRKAQWDVEFSAYQAIWKAIVPVRDYTGQLVTYEDSLQQLNITADIGDAAKMDGLRDRTKSLDEALKEFARQVHNNAPFYPQDIRQKAVVVVNELGSFTMAFLAFLIAQKKGERWNDEQMAMWRTLRNKELVAGFTAVESVDTAIRERLSSVNLVG